MHGTGEEVGAPIVEHPDVALVSFTGSTETGRIVGETCGRLHKRLSLEMGGKNAMIVLDDADPELALEGVLWGAFGTTGQRCTATSRLILDSRIHDRFLSRLADAAARLELYVQHRLWREAKVLEARQYPILKIKLGTDRDVEIIGARLRTVTDQNRCYLGTEEQQVVSSLLRAFPEDFARRLEGRAALHEDPELRAAPCADGHGGRRREAERAGAGDHQHRDRGDQGDGEIARHPQPGRQRDERDESRHSGQEAIHDAGVLAPSRRRA